MCIIVGSVRFQINHWKVQMYLHSFVGLSEEIRHNEVREKTNKMQQLDVYFQQFHSARTPQGSASQPLPTTSSRTSAAHHVR